MGWELYSHDADMGVRGRGKSLAEAFEQAALALTAVVTEPEAVRPLERVDIECAAPDVELLLYDWLNAIVYEMAQRDLLFGRYRVSLQDGRLQGSAEGERIDPARHRPTVEIKGATMTDLAVRKTDDGAWLAQCVVDV